MSRPLSITARISLLFALSTTVILLVTGFLFERAGNDRFLDNDRKELTGKLDLVRDLLGSARTAQQLETLPQRLKDVAVGHPGMAILIKSDDAVLYAGGDRPVLEHLASGKELDAAQPTTWRLGERIFRIAAGRFELGIPGQKPAMVAIALDISEDQAFLREFEEFLWFGIVQTGLAVGWLGWVVVRHGLAPLRGVSTQISTMSAQALDRPLVTKQVPSELEGLVTAFNAMRERLLDSFLRLTEFSDDLAHELRTPINNLLLQTQVTLDGEASLEHYRAALQANEEECQRLSRMISDMLFLAKADNRLVHPKREPLILGQEVSALLDFYEPLASEGGIQLEQSGSATLSGDRLMLRRALSNLLSNAIRYTAPGLSVCVCIDASEPDWVSLSVTNPGPEIPVDQRERIFERLYRGDPSRQDGRSDNVGLGLAISRPIAKLHGGDILVSCLDGENTFTLRLPREAPSEGAAQPEISK